VGKFGYELLGKTPKNPLSNLSRGGGTVGEYSLGKTGQFSLDRLANCLGGWWVNMVWGIVRQYGLGIVGQFGLGMVVNPF